MAIIILSFIRRIFSDFDAPLWLDETYTGAIAIQPTLSGLLHDCLNDQTGPIYYSFMWGWEKLFGASNVSLRTPSLVFGLAAPIVILAKGHPDKFTRWMWAALVAAWLPGFFYAREARSYTLLFLLGTAQVILFMQMLAKPNLRRALGWAGISAVFLLTHYYSALVTAFQALAYLTRCSRAALRTWPAAFLFAPAAVWMAVHLPFVFRFSKPDVAWQHLIGAKDILALPAELVGLPRFSWAVLLILLAGAAFVLFRRRGLWTRPNLWSGDAVAVAASLLSVLVVLALGAVRPSFAFRYLIPFVPGLLLGAAIWTRALSSGFRTLPWLVLGFLLLSILWNIRAKWAETDWRTHYSWERASADLVDAGARRLIFTWDNPSGAAVAKPLLKRVASFFFDRAGRPIETELVVVAGPGDMDPNERLLTTANRSGDAIIWVYDTQVVRTRALAHPPRLTSLDPKLTCRNYGSGPNGIIACLRPRASERVTVKPAPLGAHQEH